MWDGHLGCCVKKRQNKLLAKCSLGICTIHLCVCRSGQRTTVRWVRNRRIICVNRWGSQEDPPAKEKKPKAEKTEADCL